MGGQFDRGGGLLQRELVRDQWTHIKLAGKDPARYLALQREIGGVAANQILLVYADDGQVEACWFAAFRVGEQ